MFDRLERELMEGEPWASGLVNSPLWSRESEKQENQQKMNIELKLYYVTLNNTDEVLQIVQVLLEEKLAVCVNWFAITCAYRWESKIVQEPEIVLIIKTQSGYRERIEEVIRQHISYTNFITELTSSSVNQEFLDWLNKEIPNNSLVESIG